MTAVTQLKLKFADANFHVDQGNEEIAQQRRLIAKLGFPFIRQSYNKCEKNCLRSVRGETARCL